MTEQQRAQEVFLQLIEDAPGALDPVILFGMLGDELFHACGYRGALASLDDFATLTDAEARSACDLIPRLLDVRPSDAA